jgi:hypothetical protein
MDKVKIEFVSFNLGDVEDPEVYCAQPICEWQQTDHGKWVMENCIEQPVYSIFPDHLSYGYKVSIYGFLTPKDATFYNLKYK